MAIKMMKQIKIRLGTMRKAHPQVRLSSEFF